MGKVQQYAEKLPEEAHARREAIRQSVLFYWLQVEQETVPALTAVSGRGFVRSRSSLPAM
ncbi:MAG: hypothetical protein R3B47_18530 [Bacteroidia bacterium]